MEFDEAITSGSCRTRTTAQDGNGVGAVRMARMLGYPYGIVVGDWAIGPGWIESRAPSTCLGLPRIRRREGGSTQLATLQPPPPEMQQLLGAVQGNQPAMDDFISVNAGTLSPEVFFLLSTLPGLLKQLPSRSKASGANRYCGTIDGVARWVCPNCEREFASANQAHFCVPGITVDALLARHPAWVG